MFAWTKTMHAGVKNSSAALDGIEVAQTLNEGRR